MYFNLSIRADVVELNLIVYYFISNHQSFEDIKDLEGYKNPPSIFFVWRSVILITSKSS